jgi:hypothetical protein
MRPITKEDFSARNIRELLEKDTRTSCRCYFDWSGINVGYLPWIIAGYRICENRMAEQIEAACNKYPDLRDLFEEMK